jgi:hypothetical protein
VDEAAVDNPTAEEPVDETAAEDIAQECWQWQQAFLDTTPVVFLDAGANTFTLQSRPAGVKLERLLLTNDLDFVPED